MKRLVHYVKSKLSIKVSLWVVMFAAVIFMAALGFFFVEVSKTVHIEAVTRASKVLDNTCLRVEGILNRVEVANNMTCLLAQRHINDPDSMMVYCQGMLKSNPDFYNCSIAFEPYYFEDKGKYFSAYSRRAGDSIKTMQGGSDRYQYFYMDWYLSPKLLDRPCWTDPYIEVDVSTNTGYMVTSYCQPIKDNNGEFVGVVNTSLSLNWLSHTVSHTKPYPNSYSFMIGRGGTFLVHPDSTKPTTDDHPNTVLKNTTCSTGSNTPRNKSQKAVSLSPEPNSLHTCWKWRTGAAGKTNTDSRGRDSYLIPPIRTSQVRADASTSRTRSGVLPQKLCFGNVCHPNHYA